MVKFIYTLFLLVGLIRVMGQEPIEVTIEDRPCSRGIQKAFEVRVPQANAKEAINLWEKTIIESKLFKKSAKMEKVNDEWIVNNFIISDISSKPLNLITQVSSYPGHVYVRIFLQTESGFLGAQDSAQQTTDAVKDYLRNYGVDLYRLAVEDELKEEEKILKGLKKDAEQLVQKNKSHAERIEEANSDKIGLEGELFPGMEESEKKSTEKELKKAGNTVSKFEKKVEQNERDQRDIAGEIEKQEAKVEDVKTKLSNIK